MIDIDSPLTISFLDHTNIGYPNGILGFSDKSYTTLSTFLSMAFYLSSVKLLFFYQTNLYLGSMFSLWLIISKGIMGMSDVAQAKMSELTHRKSSSWIFSFFGKRAPTWIDFSG